jgi:hypothetical protein
MTELAQQEIPTELRATPALVGQLEELADVDARLAKLRERQAELEAAREELREKLAKRVEPGWWKIGEFTLRRTRVEPRPSIDAWKAIEEKAVALATLRPYMTDSRPYERWTLKRRRKARISA